jgi:hypothetical protein
MLSAMNKVATIKKRAADLAASGKCQVVNDVLFWLKIEGFPQDLIDAPALRVGLLEIVEKAKTNARRT